MAAHRRSPRQHSPPLRRRIARPDRPPHPHNPPIPSIHRLPLTTSAKSRRRIARPLRRAPVAATHQVGKTLYNNTEKMVNLSERTYWIIMKLSARHVVVRMKVTNPTMTMLRRSLV